MNACTCKSENFVCDPMRGCVCRLGFTGSECFINLADQRVGQANIEKPSDDSSSVVAWMVVGIIIALLLIILAFGAIIYLHRRNRRLKQELAYVTYTADPRGSSDQTHFDNPVYTYQSVAMNTNLNNSLANGAVKQIHNNIAVANRPGASAKNIEKAKLAELEDDPVDDGAVGGMSSAKLNFHEEAYNPNLYSSIEDLKVADKAVSNHLYDEVKTKNADKVLDPNEGYDHLEYNRPSSERKPHYHRMDSTKSMLTSKLLPDHKS